MRKAILYILILTLLITSVSCGNKQPSDSGLTSDETTSSDSTSEAGIDTTSPDASATSNGGITNPAVTGATTAKNNPGGPSKTAVKLTDGNIYVLTDDRHYIVKIDPNFRGYEKLYEGNFRETLYQPVYRNDALFFSAHLNDGSEKIYRLDLSTKKVKEIFKSAQIPGYSDWKIVGDKIFIRCIQSGEKTTLWTCNLDGSNLKKTSAQNAFALSLPSEEYNGKLYLIGYYGNHSTSFYEMNPDGSGLKKLFSQSHLYCVGYNLLCVFNGYIYYSATNTRTDPGAAPGTFKIKISGGERKKIFTDTVDFVITDGNYLYTSPIDYSSGIFRIDKNDNVTEGYALKNIPTLDLYSLYNGFAFSEGEDFKNYIWSLSTKKVYNIADYSPPSPFKDLKDGFNLRSLPKKTAYKVGEGFDSTGFDFVYYGLGSGILDSDKSSIAFVTADGVTLTEGRLFTTPGTKTVEIRYRGFKQTTFTITVTGSQSTQNAGVYVLSYPSKISYKVNADGFDTSGLNVIYRSEDGKETNINDKIKFYTSKTVELYQGRKFTTTGEKVVELRYNDKVIGTYKVTVNG